MTVLSFRRNSKHRHSSTNASLFSSNKSLLKVPEDTVYRSLNSIEWKDVSVSQIVFDVSLPTWSFIKLDMCHEKDGTWRIKSKEVLNRLTGNENIINCIKAQRLAWFGHVHRMPDDSMVRKVYEWSPALTRSQGRPKNRWEDDVKNDITRMKITNWKDCITNRNEWKKLVEKVKTSTKL
jgi:hypothetical protein